MTTSVRLYPTGLLIWLLLAAACVDAPSSSPPSVAIVDSAGITLVRNLDVSVDTLATDLVETLRLGTIDGPPETQFHVVRGIVVDSLGRNYVIDEGTQAVRVFTSDGEFVRTFAGSGRGPGQFTTIGKIFLWRDTVYVEDLRDFRATLFDTTGSHLMSFSRLLSNGSTLQFLKGSPSGWFVADDSLFSRRSREGVGEFMQSPTTIKRLDPRLIQRAVRSREAADSLLIPVAEYLGRRIYGMIGSEGGSERFVLGNPPFFEPSPSHTIDGRGRIYIARGWPYVIDVYDASGILLRRISRAHDSVVVTDKLVEDVLRRARAYYNITNDRGGATYHTFAERSKMPRVGYVPVTRDVRASDDGWLWVRRADLEPDPAVLEWSREAPPRPAYWDVFDPDGIFRTTVRLPLGFTLYQVMSDAVIGIGRDELDIQYVVRYDLERIDGEKQ